MSLRVLNAWHCSPSGNIILVLLKAKRNHDVPALDPDVRNEGRGAFSRRLQPGFGHDCRSPVHGVCLILFYFCMSALFLFAESRGNIL